jgi:hypothetical protein
LQDQRKWQAQREPTSIHLLNKRRINKTHKQKKQHKKITSKHKGEKTTHQHKQTNDNKQKTKNKNHNIMDIAKVRRHLLMEGNFGSAHRLLKA